MSIVKRAKIKGKMVVSEMLIECKRCGYRDVGKQKKCPECGTMMSVTQDNSR